MNVIDSLELPGFTDMGEQELSDVDGGLLCGLLLVGGALLLGAAVFGGLGLAASTAKAGGFSGGRNGGGYGSCGSHGRGGRGGWC
jgi:hypothetical protein